MYANTVLVYGMLYYCSVGGRAKRNGKTKTMTASRRVHKNGALFHSVPDTTRVANSPDSALEKNVGRLFQ